MYFSRSGYNLRHEKIVYYDVTLDIFLSIDVFHGFVGALVDCSMKIKFFFLVSSFGLRCELESVWELSRRMKL